MQEIPQPELLDPDRLLLDDRNDLTADEHANRAALLNQALHDSCDYAQQLWQRLDAVRGYLLGSLPPDPRSPDGPVRRSATPAGPDDEQGWQAWVTAYAAVTSVLAGPHGDSGFGTEEAEREARDRRLPVPAEPAWDAEPAQGAEQVRAAESVPATRAGHAGQPRNRWLLAGRVAVVLLAVRGLRRGRP